MNSNKKSTPPEPDKNRVSFLDVVDRIADRADPIIKIFTSISEKSMQAKEVEAKFRVKVSWIAVGIVMFIVLIAAILCYVGKLDGSTFGFLLGTVVGYVLTFVRDSLAPQRRKSEE